MCINTQTDEGDTSIKLQIHGIIEIQISEMVRLEIACQRRERPSTVGTVDELLIFAFFMGADSSTRKKKRFGGFQLKLYSQLKYHIYSILLHIITGQRYVPRLYAHLEQVDADIYSGFLHLCNTPRYYRPAGLS